MKIAPIHLSATEIRFSKFSVLSAFSNWLYSSERKPRNAGNYQFFENVFVEFSMTPPTYVRTMILRIQTQKI